MSSEVSDWRNLDRTYLALAATAMVGLAGVGYFVYSFDKKRRAAPDYKQKIREKRKSDQQIRLDSEFPDFENPAEVEQYIKEGFEEAMALMAEGDLERGALRLATVMLLTRQNPLMLQGVLPPDHFEAFQNALPVARQRIGSIFRRRNLAKPTAGGDQEAEDSDEQNVVIIDEELE